jgi:hypothetical protein
MDSRLLYTVHFVTKYSLILKLNVTIRQPRVEVLQQQRSATMQGHLPLPDQRQQETRPVLLRELPGMHLPIRPPSPLPEWTQRREQNTTPVAAAFPCDNITNQDTSDQCWQEPVTQTVAVTELSRVAGARRWPQELINVRS